MKPNEAFIMSNVLLFSRWLHMFPTLRGKWDKSDDLLGPMAHGIRLGRYSFWSHISNVKIPLTASLHSEYSSFWKGCKCPSRIPQKASCRTSVEQKSSPMIHYLIIHQELVSVCIPLHSSGLPLKVWNDEGIVWWVRIYGNFKPHYL